MYTARRQRILERVRAWEAARDAERRLTVACRRAVVEIVRGGWRPPQEASAFVHQVVDMILRRLARDPSWDGVA